MNSGDITWSIILSLGNYRDGSSFLRSPNSYRIDQFIVLHDAPELDIVLLKHKVSGRTCLRTRDLLAATIEEARTLWNAITFSEAEALINKCYDTDEG